MPISRRQFLQIAGITAAAAHLPHLTFAAPSFDAVYGRALDAVPVYAAPSIDAPLQTRLWSDSVMPILGAHGGWYHLPDGYARREDLQPMTAPARRIEVPAEPPFWGEVIGAVAVVRAYCAADAPLVARIGHGGVLRVIDYLPGWYGVSEGEALIGWTHAEDWQPARIDAVEPALSLSVDAAAQRLSVLDGDRLILTAPISTGRAIPSGVYPITERRATLPDYRGAAWALRFGDGFDLVGAYWHNRFGAAHPGAAVQMMPMLARWLYPRAATVILS